MACHKKPTNYASYMRTISPRKISLRRIWQQYTNSVIAPPNIPRGQLQCLRMHMAWLLALSSVTRCHMPAKYNRMAIAHDLVETTKAAPANNPFALTRLDAERLVIDALHLSTARKGGTK